MGDTTETLTPIISRYVSPLFRRALPNKLGTESVRLFGGDCGDFRKVPGIWELESLDVDIITDATVVNRQVYLATAKAGGFSQSGIQTVDITASQNIKVRVQKSSFYSNMVPGSGTVYYTGISQRFAIFAGKEYFVCYVLNGQAGDIWQFEVTLRCLNRELNILPKGFE